MDGMFEVTSQASECTEIGYFKKWLLSRYFEMHNSG